MHDFFVRFFVRFLLFFEPRKEGILIHHDKIGIHFILDFFSLSVLFLIHHDIVGIYFFLILLFFCACSASFLLT